MPLGTIGLSTFRWNARHKSLFLVLLYPLIAAWLFWWQIYLALAFVHDEQTISDAMLTAQTDRLFYGWAGLAFLAGLLAWLVFTWWNHASVIRGMCLSTPVTGADEHHLYAILESLSIAQGIPTPELEIIDTHARNAFACDIDGEYSRIFLTRGLLESLSEDEIEAVIAHELAHILSGDSRLLSFSIAFSDLYPFLVRKRSSPGLTEAPADNMEINPLLLVHPIAFIAFMPLWAGYILTSVLRVLLFRNREFDADAAAYQMTKNADALMRALIRINRRARIPFVNQDVRFLCIDNPLGGLFATHPRLSARLVSISRLSHQPIPEIEAGTQAPLHKRFLQSPLLMRNFKKPKIKAWFRQ
jgi:heat shock protein HtpX